MLRFALVLCVIAALGACSTHPTAPAGAVSDLAPTGKLRAAINFGNPVLASKDPATGEPRGVSVDLSRELAARLGVPVELVAYAAAGRVVERSEEHTSELQSQFHLVCRLLLEKNK